MNGRLELAFSSPEEARQMQAALAPDDDGHVTSRLDGSTLVIETEGALMGVLRSMDDVLGCIRATGIE